MTPTAVSAVEAGSKYLPRELTQRKKCNAFTTTNFIAYIISLYILNFCLQIHILKNLNPEVEFWGNFHRFTSFTLSAWTETNELGCLFTEPHRLKVQFDFSTVPFMEKTRQCHTLGTPSCFPMFRLKSWKERGPLCLSSFSRKKAVMLFSSELPLNSIYTEVKTLKPVDCFSVFVLFCFFNANRGLGEAIPLLVKYFLLL